MNRRKREKKQEATITTQMLDTRNVNACLDEAGLLLLVCQQGKWT